MTWPPMKPVAPVLGRRILVRRVLDGWQGHSLHENATHFYACELVYQENSTGEIFKKFCKRAPSHLIYTTAWDSRIVLGSMYDTIGITCRFGQLWLLIHLDRRYPATERRVPPGLWSTTGLP